MEYALNAGYFPHCKKCLPSGSLNRRLVLESKVLIHNFCTELVGLHQIKTVFDPGYERCVNIEGYDRISQYYLRTDDRNSENDSSV